MQARKLPGSEPNDASREQNEDDSLQFLDVALADTPIKLAMLSIQPLLRNPRA
jgi:hypothetical protein